MPKIELDALKLFTGTERYYRISRRHLLTDGTKYLAEQAECFWMMYAIMMRRFKHDLVVEVLESCIF